MTFIHVYLLGGLALVGVPILLHLLLRQKPRRLPFAAFRFLKARQVTNQRRMRLQHLLLLALRMLILAAICLALSRPLLFSNWLSTGHQRVTAVLLFDTSPSMEYAVGKVSRLDDARERARELLKDLHPSSRVAVVGSGDDTPPPPLPLAEARGHLDHLAVRDGAGPLNRAVERALALLDKEGPATPRLLYVFTDRTRGSWEKHATRPSVPEGVSVLVVDVGVKAPRDLGIEKVEVVPPVAVPGARIEVRVTVRGTPDGHETAVSYRIDNDPDKPGADGAPQEPTEKAVRLARGETHDVVIFERAAPRPPAEGPTDVPFQVTARLKAADSMTFNDARHATFLVRGGRKMLTLVDDASRGRAAVWSAAHKAHQSFVNDVRSLDDARDIAPRDLASYGVVCLFQLSKLSAAWWDKLANYVKGGGGLAIVPAGDELLAEVKDFSDGGLKVGVLPAPLLELRSAKPDRPVSWQRFRGDHPLMAAFVKWTREADPDFDREALRPHVWRYWRLGELAKGAVAVGRYADAEQGPALAARGVGSGRVVLFTTPLDLRRARVGNEDPLWTNYYDSSFGLALIDRTCRYLAGEAAVPAMNFRCGDVPQVELPAPLAPPYTVMGPGLDGPERNLPAPAPGEAAAVRRAAQAGHYLILDGPGKAATGFSLAVREGESDLERVPAEELEAALGPGVVVEVGQGVRLKDALATLRPPPFEALPWLMMLLLGVLAAESLLSNRFYKRPAGGPSA